MREVALSRARQATGLPNGSPLTQLPLPRWSALHTPLPVGFLAAPVLAPLTVGGRAAAVSLREATATLSSGMARELATRMIEAEPERWGGEGAGDATGDAASEAAVASLVDTLGLVDAAQRMILHHQGVLSVQAAMYGRAAAPPMSPAEGEDAADAADAAGAGAPAGRKSSKAAVEVLMGEMDALDAHMASLDAWGRGVDAPLPAVAPPVSAASGGGAAAKPAKAGFGGGGGGGGGGKKKGGKKRK